MCHRSGLLLLTLLLLSTPVGLRGEQILFDRDVAPIIARHCLECHNDFDHEGELDLASQASVLAGGDSGPVLLAGEPNESLLWQRIAEDEMPPDDPLDDTEKATLKRWIESGAVWGSDPIDLFKYSSENRAGYDWWSLQPIVRPEVTAAQTNDAINAFAHKPIDGFILSRLNAAGLTPSLPADRRTLIRRLSFDLTGLPPTPDAVQQFLDDESPGAYERLVDRLLASPAYGERWARHWLDVVRFGESQGFERDRLRENAWPYRDWVVRALNRDMPYDEFARLQIAGDVLGEGETDGVIATGFLVAGPWDEVGQKQQSAAMKRVVRQDELEDYISAVGQTFLGLTINCARCHDHKFDPIRQQEYYQLAAALNGVKHGDRPVDRTRAATAMGSALEALESKIQQLEQPARGQILAARQQRSIVATPPDPIAEWDFNKSLSATRGELHAEAHGATSLQESHVRFDGKTGYATTMPIDRDLTAKTLEAWVKLETLTQRGGGVMSLQTLNGSVFDAIVFGEREPRCWVAGSNHFARTQSFGGAEETSADQQFTHIAIAWHADGTIAAYRDGLPYGEPYQSDGPVKFSLGEAQILFGLRHTPAGGNRLLAGRIDKARLYDRALSADEVAASAGVTSESISEEQLEATLPPAERELRRRWRFEADHLRKQLARLKTQTVYAVVPESQPGPMHVMRRGNPATPGEPVTPGGVASVLTGEAGFALPDDASDAERRRGLAEWITHRENPLFARVMMNRLWHYHFGAGLVPTPSDLGYNGGRPSHPQLLDWLASEFVRRGYSLKQMHRLIVTSAAYQQSSRPRSECLQVDAQDRWIWRKSPRRLEAESVRDAILAVAGVLNDEVGGPGYYDFTTYIHNTQFYELVDPIGASFNRRSLYRSWARSGRSPFLDVFDCPDPSAKSPRRAVTTTPLQSLALLNNSFVLRMADRFAERLRAEHPDDVPAQIDRAFELVYSRGASEAERQQGAEFIRSHGLPAYCRVLLNTNEFLYVE